MRKNNPSGNDSAIILKRTNIKSLKSNIALVINFFFYITILKIIFV